MNTTTSTEYTQLCVWHGTTLGDDTVESFVQFMQKSLMFASSSILFRPRIQTLIVRAILFQRQEAALTSSSMFIVRMLGSLLYLA